MSKYQVYPTIDVFEKEPPDASNPLISHPKVFATPHLFVEYKRINREADRVGNRQY
ncbi:MAG: hypothetical protein JXA66_07600 [Oligoflexia bacterium]|nr:hypothetical protein [Oligoflexia bacterium]